MNFKFGKYHLSSLALAGCLSLSVANASEEITINPIDYDTIIGEGNTFIDVGSEEFVLTKNEWAEIQMYAHQAVSLPSSEMAMRSAFMLEPHISFSQFEGLLSEFIKISNTGDSWNRSLYPEIVDLALNLANYSEIHVAYLEPLFEILGEIKKGSLPGPFKKSKEELEDLRQTAIVLLQLLKDFSQERKLEVVEKESDLKDFAADLSAQSAQLDTLYHTYSEYLTDDGSVLRQEIDILKNRIGDLNDRISDAYRDIGLSALGGPISIGVVGAIRGTEIEGYKDLRNQLEDEMIALRKKLNTKEALYLAYGKAENSIEEIDKSIEAALPHVQKLKTHWQDLTKDFDAILKQIDVADSERGIKNTVALAAAVVTNTAVTKVNDKWSDVSRKAKAFAQNAYVVVTNH